MVQIIHLTPSKLVLVHSRFSAAIRNVSKYLNKDICSKSIREKFLEYFISENNHKFVKSSPVVPYCDPTLAFVNAGMNQFKDVFLGTQPAAYKRVANSQKCVRVGGKHNDLAGVGQDGYHHTFFEMFGNWSFGDYFKEDACKMAWDLLTNVYKIPKARLYVTYFKGDIDLGIEADLETKQIWKNLGVPECKILPFGLKDNFWEMGLSGPCGPCTEIHYDHIGGRRAEFVNKGLHDLIEVWNIVFIQYNRMTDKALSPLSIRHVDTGMGFERLCSVLQGTVSNYDTDNFQYLMKAIHKNCSGLPKYAGKFGEQDWNDLDKCYRILADHSRMITVCLADGVIPEENQKFRRILRKALLLSETVFKKEQGLLKELSNYVIENLGQFYPELEKNITQVHQIINYEEELYQTLRRSSAKEWQKLLKQNPKLLEYDIIETPNFIEAYNEVTSSNVKVIDSKLAFRLYDRFGIDEEGIGKIAGALSIAFDPGELHKELEAVRTRFKESHVTDNKLFKTLEAERLAKTDDTFKYSYRLSENNDRYVFEDVNAQVLRIFVDDEGVPEVPAHLYCCLVLDKTNFYSEAGGQIGDRGTMTFGDDVFEVTSVENVSGYVLHKGFFRSKAARLRTGMKGTLKIDADVRLGCMRNHTGAHLLNAVLKKFKGATCQKSSRVTDEGVGFDVAVFGEKLTAGDVEKIEAEVNRVVGKKLPVRVKTVNSQELLGFDFMTLIPGEVYPDKGIRIVEVCDEKFLSREPCCGTHTLNTGDIEDFCIVGIKSLGRSTTSISAVTADEAKRARANGAELMDTIDSVNIYINDHIDQPMMLDVALTSLRKQMNLDVSMPVSVRRKCEERLCEISAKIKTKVKENLRDFIEIEMRNALDSNVRTTKSNKKYIVHYLRSSMMLKSVPLRKATRLCPDLPILVIAYADNTVKAQCCVPQDLKSGNFDAEKWMRETVAEVFKSDTIPPKGQDGSLVCNMKAKKVPVQEWDPLLKDSIDRAQKFIEDNL